jgi:hypothetical protein
MLTTTFGKADSQSGVITGEFNSGKGYKTGKGGI